MQSESELLSALVTACDKNPDFVTQVSKTLCLQSVSDVTNRDFLIEEGVKEALKALNRYEAGPHNNYQGQGDALSTVDIKVIRLALARADADDYEKFYWDLREEFGIANDPSKELWDTIMKLKNTSEAELGEAYQEGFQKGEEWCYNTVLEHAELGRSAVQAFKDIHDTIYKEDIDVSDLPDAPIIPDIKVIQKEAFLKASEICWKILLSLYQEKAEPPMIKGVSRCLASIRAEADRI